VAIFLEPQIQKPPNGLFFIVVSPELQMATLIYK